jgi:hypothetical protein
MAKRDIDPVLQQLVRAINESGTPRRPDARSGPAGTRQH